MAEQAAAGSSVARAADGPRVVASGSQRCAGPTSFPILHLHLLQRCNLSCAHCYSSSGPESKAALSQNEAFGSLQLARHLGYTHVAISGGEPLLSPHLGAVLAKARDLGLHVSVVTNGLRAATPENVELLAMADVVSVSLDGGRQSHDAVRGRAGAFDGAMKGIASLAGRGILCGVSCGVTSRSLMELEDVTSAALSVGARFLNFHSIEAAGRASGMSEDLMGRDEQTLLYVAAHAIAQTVSNQIAVHCDLLHKERVAELPQLIYGGVPGRQQQHAASIAERLGVLVVEPDGHLSPVCFGFDRRATLGLLSGAIATEGESVAAMVNATLDVLARAGASILRMLEDDDDWVVLNPSEELSRAVNSLAFV